MDKEGVLLPIMGEKGKDGEVALCILDRVDGDLSSPLDIYPPIALGDSRFSDWALHCIEDIFPIVGISCACREDQRLS